MSRPELARFLRERRDRLRPADLGLSTDHARRTPGLRREEVAESAHISVDYYARLEQARAPGPSPQVLDALAGALRLRAAERSHLFRLAGSGPAPAKQVVRRVRPYVAEMLDRLPDTAAIVTDAGYDVVAANPLARAVLGEEIDRQPNLARLRFLGRGSLHETSAFEEFGHIVVSRLRRSATTYAHDETLNELLTELRSGSEEFTRIWETHPVHDPGHRTKTLRHPVVGELRLNCDILLVPEDDQQVVFVTADEGSPSARALRRLRSLA